MGCEKDAGRIGRASETSRSGEDFVRVSRRGRRRGRAASSERTVATTGPSSRADRTASTVDAAPRTPSSSSRKTAIVPRQARSIVSRDNVGATRISSRNGSGRGRCGRGGRRRSGVRRVACERERERTRRTGRDDGSGPRRRSYCPRIAAGARRPEFRECTQKENFSLVRRDRSRSTFSERSFFFRAVRENSAKIPADRATVNSFAGRPGLVYFCILRH